MCDTDSTTRPLSTKAFMLTGSYNFTLVPRFSFVSTISGVPRQSVANCGKIHGRIHDALRREDFRCRFHVVACVPILGSQQCPSNGHWIRWCRGGPLVESTRSWHPGRRAQGILFDVHCQCFGRLAAEFSRLCGDAQSCWSRWTDTWLERKSEQCVVVVLWSFYISRIGMLLLFQFSVMFCS